MNYYLNQTSLLDEFFCRELNFNGYTAKYLESMKKKSCTLIQFTGSSLCVKYQIFILHFSTIKSLCGEIK